MASLLYPETALVVNPDRELDSQVMSTTEPSPNLKQNEAPLEKAKEVLGVTVHRSSSLQPHRLLQHPLVKVHVVEGDSGLYAKSRAYGSSEDVTSNVSHVIPIASRPCDLANKKKPTPVWEETIVFNSLDLTSVDHSLMLFFEVLDFSSVKRGDSLGWHSVAWAFLKVTSHQGSPNIGHKCKLQLYCYPDRPPIATRSLPVSTCPLWKMWSLHHRKKYPAYLSVSLHPVAMELKKKRTSDDQVLWSFPEEDNLAHEADNQGEADHLKKGETLLPPWSRLPGESCAVPSNVHTVLQAGTKGGTALSFSRSGRMLAVAMASESTNPIGLFSIPGGKEIGILGGHANCIHDLSWSHDDYIIVSASSDCTARCWILSATPSQLFLPHPSYVYSARFHPTIPYYAITGGYDAMVRGWRMILPSGVDEQPCYELLFECRTVCSHINSLCFSPDGTQLFSGHGRGEIRAWGIPVHEGGVLNIAPLDVKIVGFEGKTVSHIEVHPLGSRLLVQTRDSALSLVDVRVDQIQCRYKGAVSGKIRVGGCLCSCGSHVLSSSDDGRILVWNSETGMVVKEIGNITTSGTIIFHPHDNIFAMVAYGNRGSVYIFKE